MAQRAARFAPPSKYVKQAFHEVYEDIPANVEKTGKTGAERRKMLTAIALSKARRSTGGKG